MGGRNFLFKIKSYQLIYLEPHSGLANRVRVIISGLKFSDIVKQKLTLIWHKDSSLFCDFTDIFEREDKIILKNYAWHIKILKSIQNKNFLKLFFNWIFCIDFSFFDVDVKEFVWSTGTNNINLGKLPPKVRNYYFSTCHEFYFDRAYLSYLKPIKSIQKSIEENIFLFTNKTIGVHIRRTDNLESIKMSPLECFIDVMYRDIATDKEINYYLSTDDEAVEIMLKNLFPGKIITYPKNYSRNSIKGVQDAVVDLYSLSATCKIYGSYYSSFSEIAARIGNIPLNTVQKEVI